MSGREDSVHLDFDGKNTLERAERYLTGIPGGARLAVMRAMNRAVQGGATTAGREITKAYTIKQKEIRKTLTTEKANKDNLQASLISKGRYRSQAAFTHRPTSDTTGNKRKPIRVSIKKGSTHTYEDGFIWKGHIFRRVGKGRAVEFQYGPSVPIMLSQAEVRNAVGERISEDFDKRLEHETERLLNGAK